MKHPLIRRGSSWTAVAAVAVAFGLVGCNPVTSRGTCPGTVASCVQWSR